MRHFTNFLLVSALLLCIPTLAKAFDVRVKAPNPEYIQMTTAKNVTYDFATLPKDDTGRYLLPVSDGDNPVTLSHATNGAITEVIYNGDWIFPAAGPHVFTFSEGDNLTVYSRYDDGLVTVSFNCNNPAAVDITFDGVTADPTTFHKIERGAVLKVTPRDGFVVDNVRISTGETPTRDGNTWSYTISNPVTVDIITHADRAENVKVNIDNYTNVLLRDATGNILPMDNGDNYFKVDLSASPYVTATQTEGATIVMAVVNGNQLPYQANGVYRMDLSEGFNEIYLVTERSQANTVTFNVDDASKVRVKNTFGERIWLQDGTNSVVFDFDYGNPVTVTAISPANLQAVLVDDVQVEIKNNAATFNVLRGSVVDIRTGSQQATGWVTIVDEDFSCLTTGSADEPDTNTDIIDARGWILPSVGMKPCHESCTTTWGGHKLHSAGGAIAVLGGFLNTPVGDYSGDLRMTFRARLAPGYGITSHPLEILLIRHKRLDMEYKRETITLTDEWQTFTFTADNGWFYDTKIQFFHLKDVCYLIDDVKIEHRINGIEPPVADLAEELEDNSFTATWYSTTTAEEYLLSVYSKDVAKPDEVHLEDFESVATDAAGNVTSMPAGWEWNLSANGDRKQVSDNADYTSSGVRAMCFDSDGDYIVTPTYKQPVVAMSFFLAADSSDPGYDPTKGQMLHIGVLTDTGWKEWTSISISALINHYDGKTLIDQTEYLSLQDNIYAFRFETAFNPGDRVLVYIDDVKITTKGESERNYMFADKVITGQANTRYTVSGDDFDPETDYFYTVKARNSRYTSAESNEIEVFNVHVPVAHEATGITENSFTAGWDCGGKSDAFTVNLYHTLEAKADTPAALILHEDFSKVKSSGTPENPERGRATFEYVSIDQYTEMPGWTAGSYNLANGMIGGMAEIPGDNQPMPGAISTPVMDLSNNGGKCHVIVKGWFQGGDGIVVQGIRQDTFGAAPVAKDGMYQIEFDLESCQANECLTFYSPGYVEFMIDEITIVQDLKKGDKVCISSNVIPVNNKSAREYTVTELPRIAGYDLSYDVTAIRYFHGVSTNPYYSRKSNRVAFTLEGTSVENVADGAGIAISSGHGTITVDAPAGTPVAVYTVDGTGIHRSITDGSRLSIPVTTGLYIVRAGTTTAKTVVR